MKKLTKRLTALALGAVMTVTAAGASLAAGHQFSDVPDRAWYAQYVNYTYEQKLFAGTSDTTFEPTCAITRGETVTVLAKMYQQLTKNSIPDASESPFPDVSATAFYADAVSWAKSMGIIAGCGDGTFQPNRSITREELAVVLEQYLTATNSTLETTKTAVTYRDAASISSWAVQAVEELSKHGVFSGTNDRRFMPKGSTTRAEMATVITKIYQNLAYRETQDTDYQYIRYNCDENTGFTCMLSELDEEGVDYRVLKTYEEYSELVSKVQESECNLTGDDHTFQSYPASVFDDQYILAIEIQFSGRPQFATKLVDFESYLTTGAEVSSSITATIFCDYGKSDVTLNATSDIPGYVYFIPVNKIFIDGPATVDITVLTPYRR